MERTRKDEALKAKEAVAAVKKLVVDLRPYFEAIASHAHDNIGADVEDFDIIAGGFIDWLAPIESAIERVENE